MNTPPMPHAHALGAIAYGGIFILAVAYCSLFEWILHRFVMHRPIRLFGIALNYAYRAHALTHHVIFKADDTYHLKKEEDKWTIPMAWWNWMILVPIACAPAGFASWLARDWRIIAISGAATLGYYAAYETMHWCMHLPRPTRRIVERNWFFYRLNGHHLLHHRYQHKNFNVVFPLADLCLGTLRLRSPIRFKQATGPSVPDVQPLEPPRA